MTKFQILLAYWFRASNSKLVKPQPILLEKFRKIIFFLSVLFFKRWITKSQSTSLQLVDNVDDDLKMQLDITKKMGAAFFWIGYHEFNEWRYLHRFLKHDMVFVDVGANQGEYALFAAKRLKKGIVLAFEPVDSFFNQLGINIKLNGFTNIRCFNCGLGQTAASMPIYMAKETQAMAHEGLATIYPSNDRGHFVQDIQIEVFDDMDNTLALNRLDIVKIDVEGAELSVLNGMKNAILKFRPHILIEMNEITFNTAGYELNTVLEFFSKLNYTAYSINKKGGLSVVEQISGVVNCVFVPNKID
ncbi:FkbM family methyltransferase [Chryseotalea sanaruensis]|uniref:FkbM family methyltransferase n=1 Tax=Chryseotalea sanaruensis TaxID=2482724 RepID=UPI000F8CD86B|nr:FkbM family methyltransferase [Chryseotalea sanaruensis]